MEKLDQNNLELQCLADEDSDKKTLIIPVYGNEENIEELSAALIDLNVKLNGKLNVIFVIDGSPDRSGELLLNKQKALPFSSRIIFHSRNFGSFTAIRTGMEFANSKYVAVMAADLQEPPSLIIDFFNCLENEEIDIVFGQRTGRKDGIVKGFLSNSFWWLYRKMVVKDIPKGGVDIFACNRQVLQSVLEIEEPNSSLVAQLFWVGFRRKFIPYKRQERKYGKSGWGFFKRLRYMMDSIFSFTDLPIILILWLGGLGFLVSSLSGLFIIIFRLLGMIKEPGYAGIIVFISFSTSIILLVQGIIGSYLWRAFENTKKRPLRIISHIVDSE